MTVPTTLVVGAGASGTFVIEALRRVTSAERPRLVIIVERTARLGPGLPYDPERWHPVHTFGRSAGRRTARGAQLASRFAKAARSRPTEGWHVEVCSGEEVLDVQAGGMYAVRSSSRTVTVDQVVLAAGHWLRRSENPGWIADPWDARKLVSMVEGAKSVAVVGMAQSGIDATLAIAYSRGQFHEVDGECVYSSSPAWSVSLHSRRGLLPHVFGAVAPRDQSWHQEPRSLDELSGVVHERAGGAPTEQFDTFVGRLGARPTTPERFEARLWAARESHRTGVPISGQQASWDSLPLVHRTFPRLGAEDRLSLLRAWTPLMTWLEAIHSQTAARLVAMMRSGHLRLSCLGVHPDASQHLGRDHDAVIDCRGMPLDVPTGGLLGRLREQGLLRSGRVPFTLDPPSDACVDGRPIVDGTLDVGGIDIDPATYRARHDRGTHRNLYVLGPATIGHFPLYTGLFACRQAADRIAAEIQAGD